MDVPTLGLFNRKGRDMQLNFEGQTHSIDANTLINVLVHYQAVVTEANKQYGGGVYEVRLEVNAIEKGSFVIDISVVQNIVQQLFSKESVAYIAGLVGVIDGVYNLYKAFKGRPVKTKDDVEKASQTLNINGDVSLTIKNITNVYNQPVVREAISKSVETADEDPNVEGFSISKGKDEPAVTFEREEFKDYIYTDFDTEEDMPDERAFDETVTLTIVGLNFERGSRWQFMYNGFKISTVVKDDALMSKIDEGERFGKGDAIRVKLRTVQRYNKDYKAYENKSFKIVEFYEHIINKEGDLFNSAQ